jgi:hypothetical protein
MSKTDFEDGLANPELPLEAPDEQAGLLGNGEYSQSLTLRALFRS